MNAEELGRRAVACNGWRWMKRMSARPGISAGELGRIIVDEVRDGVPIRWHFEGDLSFSLWRKWASDLSAAIPDLTDPATLGCLLALVREAWSCPTVCVVHEGSDHPDPWAVRARRGEALGIGVTEAEALVLALEAAP